MKKTMTRIAACSLAVLIAFGSVCYKPPKARAFGVESAFAAAATYSYLEAVGMSFEGTVYDGMRDSLLDIFVDLSENFVNGLGILRYDFEAIVAEGVDFLENGHVRISSAAANMLGQFSDWLIDKFGLISGGESVPVYSDSGWFVNGERFPVVYYQDWREAMQFELNKVYTTGSGNEFYFRWVDGPSGEIDNGLVLNGKRVAGKATFYNPEATNWCMGYTAGDGTDGKIYFIVYGSERIVAQGMGSTDFYFSDLFGEYCESSLSVSLPADYEAPPKVEEQYSMVIDTGMSFEDEQEFIDSVLAGVAAGTLSPTYDIEETENRDVVVPGEVTDTQAGILSWVKTIAQRVSALPQSISEAVKSIFVPDAALTTQITDAFAAKFSFVPTLHRLGTDLLSIGPDSKPPVVYIHLEDAEGNIDYGGTVKALDMSWYERYKEDGDRIIGGFLWLGFLWLLFKRVPAIINGGEMVQEYTADIDRGSKRRKH